MTERFTKEQVTLSEGVKGLIELYCLDELAKPVGEWSWDRIGESLTKFLTRIFGRCTFDQETKMVQIDTGPRIKHLVGDMYTIHIDNRINVDDVQLRSFVEIMDGLRDATINDELVHLFLRKERNDIENSIAKRDLQTGDYIGLIEEDERIETREFPEGLNWERLHRLTDKTGAVALRTGLRCVHFDDEVAIFSSNFRSFYADPLSQFGRLLLDAEPQEKPLFALASMKLFSHLSFIQIVRSVLVNYHAVFGNFDRIKLCKYCGRLFFEKRRGSRDYCSNRCRRSHFASQEPEEKFKCRDRQNQWIVYQFDRNRKLWDLQYKGLEPITVSKSECANCNSFPRGGLCSVLREKNREAFHLVEIGPE